MDPSAPRRLTLARIAGIGCAALLTLAAGRLLVDGITIQNEAGAESAGSALRIVGGLLLAITGLTWAGGLCYRGGTAGRLPLGLVLWICLSFGLLGGYWANRSPVMLIVVAVTLPFAVLSVVMHERWRARQLGREQRDEGRVAALTARGVISSGVVIGVQQTGRTSGEDPELLLNVRFTVDGSERTGTATAFYPEHDLPRSGDQVIVRYLPEDPAVVDIQENRVPVVPAPAGGLSLELERLARLHRDGSLTDGEFSAAKSRLLG
ncbi:hypothetical protein F4553_000415 [Allocatelliglobosispora scoriae]|uniref:SHOCT domain-containing protein n=1 Tax=Allocatelliglobosispora scoriae TaxID=643052 RepID=A0A841BIL8_9ACTN|nr:SHOCT domain-containing protein [Allocatelliglobosispora scoriae]MBB5867036.1 hypothetical protein [Allocatelliglobosispora scoriae]